MGSSIHHLFHPTDLSPESRSAFEHALRIALAARAKLTVMHVRNGPGEEDWEAFPGVREVLERWRILPPGSDVRAIEGLGIHVRKVMARAGEPVEACIDHLERHPAQLLVMATGQRSAGHAFWNNSIAGRLAAQARIMSLFLPHGAHGFVDSGNGSVNLRRVLVPVDRTPDPAPGIDALDLLAGVLSAELSDRVIHHAGTTSDLYRIPNLPGPNSGWERFCAPDEPVKAILGLAKRFGPDLVVMATQGRKGIKDALLGSTTERVLASIRSPVLTVPSV